MVDNSVDEAWPDTLTKSTSPCKRMIPSLWWTTAAHTGGHARHEKRPAAEVVLTVRTRRKIRQRHVKSLRRIAWRGVSVVNRTFRLAGTGDSRDGAVWEQTYEKWQTHFTIKKYGKTRKTGTKSRFTLTPPFR